MGDGTGTGGEPAPLDPETLHLPDHTVRLDRVRQEAAWVLGDEQWADDLIAIYCGDGDPCQDAADAWKDR